MREEVSCFFVFDLSWQINPNQPSEVHDVVDAVGIGVDRWDLAGGSEPSRQSPNHPVYWQDVVVDDNEVVVAVGAGAGVVVWDVVFVVVSSSSLQPNQPGVLHVEVDEVLVLVVVVAVAEDDVDSSRHPHQPGVLHVSVRVRVDLEADADVDVGLGLDDDVVVSVPLLSKYSHV
jgi:hypothetical protein